VISFLCLWSLVYGLGISALQEHRSQTELYAAFRQQLAEETAPLGGIIAPGSPVGLIDAPAAGLNGTVVVEGTSSGDLRLGPGHLRGTPLPGQPGTSYLFGRSVTFGGPFRHASALAPADPITVTTGQGTFQFVVEDVRRAGDPLPPSLPENAGRLTLVTSEGSGWRNGWAPSHLVYVDARLVGSAKPAPVGAPLAVPGPETAMQWDSRALVPLAFWLELLLAVVVAAVWGRARWGTWQVWLVGLPVLVAVLAGLTATAARLLPNLL
jgi:sortase A